MEKKLSEVFIEKNQFGYKRETLISIDDVRTLIEIVRLEDLVDHHYDGGYVRDIERVEEKLKNIAKEHNLL